MSKTETKETQKQTQAVSKIKKDITDVVLDRVTELREIGELQLPSDYSVANALKSAFLVLQEVKDKNKKQALEVCTKNSISQALLKMVLEGLSVYKKQGYFIVYGTELTWMRSYQGSRSLAKRVAGVKNVIPQVIYKNDVFNYEIDVNTGRKKIIKHEQKIENIDNDSIIGGYAVIIHADGSTDLEVMTIKEIEQSWKQGYGKGDVHKKFTQEMVKKTLINRSCKGLINSSNDGYLEDDNEEPKNKSFDNQEKQVNKELDNEMASEEVDFEEVEEVTEEQENAQQIEAGF
jgi:recombination protein RecT